VDKLERLLNLTMTLLETARPLTANELRSRIPGYPEGEGSFRRAFERDKESLREMGIPVTKSLVPGSDPPADGYRIAKDEYYLRDPGFKPDELAALHLAASAVKLDTSHGIEALWKLGGTVEGADEALPAARPTDALVALPSDPRLAPLFSAVVERRSVALTYNGTDRTVDPYRLDFQRGRWYLTGYDHVRGEERNYRVDRIEAPRAEGRAGAFERPSTAVAGGPAQPWQFDEQDPVTATVLVDADQSPWVRQHLGDDALVDERDDGSILVQLEVTNRPAFRSFVLTFLDHAEVIGPPDLRAEVVEWVAAVAAGPLATGTAAPAG
jgi:proteasome accessory factor B